MAIYEIIGSIDIVTLFQRVLVPVLMISGIGLFILVIQTRYGRIVDRIRILNSERLELIKKEILKKVSKIEKIWNDYRLKGIQEQVTVLIIRGKLLKDALKYMFISIFTAIISSLLLLVEQIIRFSLLLAICFCNLNICSSITFSVFICSPQSLFGKDAREKPLSIFLLL